MKVLRQALFVVAILGMFWLLLLSDGKGLIADWAMANDWPILHVVLIAAVFYAVLLAIPFFPSVEFGWLIMAAFGTIGILAIWLVTPLGLLLAYGIGYWLRDWHWVARVRQRAAALPAQPSNNWRQRSLSWGLTRLGTHPYLMLVVLINLPGNWVIGGGGGIGIMAGASGLYRPWWFVLVLVPATGIVAAAMLLGIELRN